MPQKLISCYGGVCNKLLAQAMEWCGVVGHRV